MAETNKQKKITLIKRSSGSYIYYYEPNTTLYVSETGESGDGGDTTVIQVAVDEINSKIPAAASAENQLADKDWVNSSIATATSTFRGTFETESDLPKDGVMANDYAFIIFAGEDGNPEYRRYKYADGAWVYEYTLNNSSFTADQWSAINSGITKEKLEEIESAGVVKIGAGLTRDEDGAVSIKTDNSGDSAVTIESTETGIKTVAKTASEEQAGVVKIGAGLSVSDDGTISAKVSGITIGGKSVVTDDCTAAIKLGESLSYEDNTLNVNWGDWK